jgi:hypothetical protein
MNDKLLSCIAKFFIVFTEKIRLQRFKAVIIKNLL